MHAHTERILRELKRARVELQGVARTTLPWAIRAIGRIEARLSRPLRAAIVGEFNSGKSSLANLLVGIESLPTAVVSSTRIPTLLYHALRPEVWATHHDGRREQLHAAKEARAQSIIQLEVGLPSARLREMEILDLPGLANPRFEHRLCDLFLQNVDIVLWCTASIQAWKESERAAWDRVPARLRDRALLVVTHGDLVHEATDQRKLLRRLQKDAFSFRDVVLISTNEALASMRQERKASNSPALEASGANALDSALAKLLLSVREDRTKAAIAVTRRIAQVALSRLE
jgi:tRNA U34 5-carboxymethylaminomethyl modifying GTPase MnmE/TrmE